MRSVCIRRCISCVASQEVLPATAVSFPSPPNTTGLLYCSVRFLCTTLCTGSKLTVKKEKKIANSNTLELEYTGGVLLCCCTHNVITPIIPRRADGRGGRVEQNISHQFYGDEVVVLTQSKPSDNVDNLDII